MTARAARGAAPSEPIVIGLGGNLGGEPAVRARFVQARAALAILAGPEAPVRSAPLYRTAPIGPRQPRYLNSAVLMELPAATPAELIATVLELEILLGRDRRGEVRWGPRAIDLDVLVWGARAIRRPDLEIPHPRLAERRFALAPLVALVGPGFEIPGAGRAGGLLARAAAQAPHALEEVSPAW